VNKTAAPFALAALLCLPCLLPVIAAVIGVAAFSAMGGWLAGNALAVALGSSAAAVGAAFVTYVVLARRRRTNCEPSVHFEAEREMSGR